MADLKLFRVIMPVVVLLFLGSPYAHGSDVRHRACQRGGGMYCSVGKKRSSYIGLLDTAQQLKEALEATAFQKEIIVFAETRIFEASQTVARLAGIGGYAHVLPVMSSVADCQQLSYLLAPWQSERGPVSCGSYSSEDSRGQKYPFMLQYFARGLPGSPAWWAKWLTVARAVLLGYNVMAVDSDTVVLDDWYWRVKQPPLALYNMLSQAESAGAINGGFSYIQNVASNGPVAWLLYEAVFRMVRWAEDPSVIANASQYVAKTGAIQVDDQTLITDTMLSCAIGRPVFWSLSTIFEQTGADAAFRTLGITNGRLELQRTMWDLARNSFSYRGYIVQGALADHICDKRLTGPCQPSPDGRALATIRTASLSMPHSGGEWPLKLGGYPFNPKLGPYSLAYQQAFKDLGVPLPPDPEDRATEGAARETPPELLGLLNLEFEGGFNGSWAESTWWASGRLGYWHRHLWPQQQPALPVAQAMGHVFAGLWPGDLQKSLILKLTGHFDWRVAARLAGSPFRVFFMQHREPPPGVLEESQQYGPEFKLVVAYAPDVVPPDLDRKSFVTAAQGLAKVALALGAVVAWPAAPCRASWAQRKVQQTGTDGATEQQSSRPWNSIPWTQLDTSYTVQPFGDTLEHLQCEWVGFSESGCVQAQDTKASSKDNVTDAGSGLLAVEFHHLRHVLASKPPSSQEEVEPQLTTGVREPGGAAIAVARARRHRGLQPSPATTLRLFQEDPAKDAQPDASDVYTVEYRDIVQLNLEAVLAARRRDSVSVLWLDRLVGQVAGMKDDAAALYETWKSRCRALRYFDIPEDQRTFY